MEEKRIFDWLIDWLIDWLMGTSHINAYYIISNICLLQVIGSEKQKIITSPNYELLEKIEQTNLWSNILFLYNYHQFVACKMQTTFHVKM